jgi:hypothetical protein
VIPYGTLSPDMVWKIYYFLHFVRDQEAADEEELENLHTALGQHVVKLFKFHKARAGECTSNEQSCLKIVNKPGLPDGIFSSQKSLFG